MNTLCREMNAYLDKRIGTYEFRCRRYEAVCQKLEVMGFETTRQNCRGIIVDLGAGRGEFGAYLRTRFSSSKHIYIPLDASIDGIDLDNFRPWIEGITFYTAIEFLEHLPHVSVMHYLSMMPYQAKKGAVITTPDPETTDVLAMDVTHKTPIHAAELMHRGWNVEHQRLFTEHRDTIVAWKEAP